MTFYVQKSLATGPIRFGVSPRDPSAPIDEAAALSTGARGEFLRRRLQGFFFGDSRPLDRPALPATKSISSMPFWTSLKPDGTPKGYAFLASMALGTIFVLLGLAVLARKGRAGWVEVILGAIMIGVPIVMTAQQRKQIREREERERAEREAEEARNRAMLASFTAALERLRSDRGADAIDNVRREREALTLPYELFAPLARRTVLDIGFEELAKRSPAAAGEVAEIVDAIGSAAGLSGDDIAALLGQLYDVAEWHLIADDRFAAPQSDLLTKLRWAFNVREPAPGIEELERLHAIDRSKPKHAQCTAKLGFQEWCIHETRGTRMQMKKRDWVEEEPCTLTVTNKRLIVTAKKTADVPMTRVFEINVDGDRGMLSITTADPKNPIHVKVAEPIYTAGMIDLATTLNPKPRGFA